MTSVMASPARPQTNSNAALWSKVSKDSVPTRAPFKPPPQVTIRVQSREDGLKVDTGHTIADVRERLRLSFDTVSFYMNGREVNHISEAFLIISKTNYFEILFRTPDYHGTDIPLQLSFAEGNDLANRALCLAMGDNVFATFTKSDGTHEFNTDIEQLLDEGVIKEKHLPRELPRTAVKRLDRLGGGAFGDVFKGYLEEPNSVVPPYLVAIKCLKGSPTPWERKEFLREAAIMAQIRHKNLVSLVGVVTKGEPYMLLLQFCEHGSLDIFLKNHTGILDLSLVARLQIARDVCEGSCYLADNGFIHRDIAARNVLVASDWTCKLADFGLSKSVDSSEVYVQGDRGKIPIRWSSPEVLEDGRFSEKSDVWAYGVVLYEIMSRGQTPYRGMANNEVWRKVCGGYRLERPVGTPDNLHALMQDIWADFEPRPTFRDILPRIQAMYDEEAKNEVAQFTPNVSELANSTDSFSAQTTLDSMGSISLSRSFSMSQSLSRSFSASQQSLSRSVSISNSISSPLNRSLSSSQQSLALACPTEHEYVYNYSEADIMRKQADQASAAPPTSPTNGRGARPPSSPNSGSPTRGSSPGGSSPCLIRSESLGSKAQLHNLARHNSMKVTVGMPAAGAKAAAPSSPTKVGQSSTGLIGSNMSSNASSNSESNSASRSSTNISNTTSNQPTGTQRLSKLSSSSNLASTSPTSLAKVGKKLSIPIVACLKEKQQIVQEVQIPAQTTGSEKLTKRSSASNLASTSPTSLASAGKKMSAAAVAGLREKQQVAQQAQNPISATKTPAAPSVSRASPQEVAQSIKSTSPVPMQASIGSATIVASPAAVKAAAKPSALPTIPEAPSRNSSVSSQLRSAIIRDMPSGMITAKCSPVSSARSSFDALAPPTSRRSSVVGKSRDTVL